MANGVLRSEADYYNDSETYTGDPGTETNKYVIEDVYDFINMGSAPYTEFTIVNDIDFSDHETYRYGMSNISLVSNSYTKVYANGHAIRNLIYKNSTASLSPFSFGTLYDAILENLIIIGKSSRPVFDCGCVRCKFGAYIFSGYTGSVYVKNCTDSSFNICGVCLGNPFSTCYSYPSNISYKRCHINFDLVSLSGNELTEFSGSITDTYFTGKCEFKSNMSRILGAGSWYTSYVSVEVTIPNTSDEIGFAGSMYGGISFINIDLLPKNAADAVITDGEFYALTDEQCKDANYLASIGFPVLPV